MEQHNRNGTHPPQPFYPATCDLEPSPLREHLIRLLLQQVTVAFWQQVTICPHGPTCHVCCWPWFGPYTDDGDTHFRVSLCATLSRSQRIAIDTAFFSYWVTRGSLPPSMHVEPICGDATCCNPFHMQAVGPCPVPDQTVLSATMSHTPTGPNPLLQGERHPNARLTPDQVREIRALAGTMTQGAIAKRFGISDTHVSKIHLRERWRHL